MAVIQMWRRGHGDEKLAAIGIGAGVRHGKHTRLRMAKCGMEFIGELIAGAAPSGALRTSTLDHEVRNHAVKDDAVIEGLACLFPFREIDEVLHRLGALSSKSFTLKLPSVVSNTAW